MGGVSLNKITIHQSQFYNKNYYPYLLKYDIEFIKKTLKGKRKTKLFFNNKKCLSGHIKKRWTRKTQLIFKF